jgi:sialate O-acetylesterase
MQRLFLAGLTLAAAALPAQADIKPHPLVSSGMVLQRGLACPLWGTAEPGEKITARLSGAADKDIQGETTADKNGAWIVKLDVPQKAGGPFTLTLEGKNKLTLNDVYIGEVWVGSGQSNMEWTMNLIQAKKDIEAAANPKIRLFTVQKTTSYVPLDTVVGQWQACTPETVTHFSAVAYYFGRDLNKALDVPIGLIHSSWGGTVAEAWTSAAKLQSIPSLAYMGNPAAENARKYQKALGSYLKDLDEYLPRAKRAWAGGKALPPPRFPINPPGPNTPSVLYNAMIRPLQPFAIKGVIWYQGESNAGRAYEYRTLFPAMIDNWREDWKLGDFPFLFVQLAPWMAIVKQPQESTWAELREAQLLTSQKVKNTAQAVITDVGDPRNIHPPQKAPVGHRLALAARAMAYGETIVYSGPTYDSVEFKDGKAILSFKNVGKGLEAKDGELTGFTIAGSDRKWHNAQAKIEGDKVVVWSDEVKEPAAVRYGWYNCPVVNLWNKDSLPASPFRTDDFPMLTREAKKTPTKGKGPARK